MSVALDITAHPANAGNLLASKDSGTTWQTIPVGPFSTGSGPVIIRAFVFADGGAIPFGGSAAVAWVGGTPSGWSAFTKRVDNTSVGHDFGVQVWTAFAASTAASAQTVAFTANTNSPSQSGSLWLLVENGVASTEAACIGNNGGYIDESGGTHLVAASINPASTGSSLAGVYLNTNIHTALTANAQTATFDAHHEATGSDAVAFGRYKVSGTYTPSTAGSAKTLGATDTDAFTAVAILEIQPAGGGSSFTGTQAETATPSVSFVGSQAMGASEAEIASPTDTYAAAQAMVATQAESTSAAVLLDGAVLIPASQSESAQALDSYALALALSVQQSETATPGFSLACSLAMGATYLEATSPSVSFDDGTPAPRRVAGFPFWPWWYRLHPYNRRRIM